MRYKKIIGGTVEDAEKKFPWIKKAKITNAEIDISGHNLAWNNGIWGNGIWEYGRWEYGRWNNGAWLGGVWLGGVWKTGLWEKGLWVNGVWQDGVWQDGIFCDGLWQDGLWKKGSRRPVCRWNIVEVNGNISINGKIKTIKEWDVFFKTDKEYEKKKQSDQSKMVRANYEAVKTFLKFLK